MNISELNKLTQNTISDIDLMFVQDVSETETKVLLSSDLSNYIVSASNLPTNLKSGSFTGSFTGNLNGTITNTSKSLFSNYAFKSNYLNYPNNSSSSYALSSISSSNSTISIDSITSSYSSVSTNSVTSSYTNTCIINNSFSSSTSNISLQTNYATSSNYLIYNGIDNGKVYKSIISEYSPSASIGISLLGNTVIEGDSYWGTDVLVNNSTSSRALSSSFSSNANSARYIKNVAKSDHASFALNTDMVPFAYVNFSVKHTNGTNWEFLVNQYKNIKDPGIGLAKINNTVAIFTGSYQNPPSAPEDPNILPSSTILAETSFNFPFDPYVNYWFTTFSFPIGLDKFAICVRIGVVVDDDTSNILLPLLNNSNISAIMFSNVTGVQSPKTISKSSVLNAALLEGCARI